MSVKHEEGAILHALSMQNERNPSRTNRNAVCWSGLGACKHDSTRSFHHIYL